MRLDICHGATLPLPPSEKCVYRLNCTYNEPPNVHTDQTALKMTYKSIIAYFPYISILTDFTILTKMTYSVGITLTADVPTLTYYMAFIISNMSTMT